MTTYDGDILVPKGIKRLARVFCGCGNPEMAWAEVGRHLRRRRDRKYGHDWDGKEYVLAYLLDRLELTEHGSNVMGAWPTLEGLDVIQFLEKYGEDWQDYGPFVDDEGVTVSNTPYKEVRHQTLTLG